MTENNKEQEVTDVVPAFDKITPFDSLNHYIMKAKRFPLLTEEEEKKLVLKYIDNKDKEAAYRLITSHLMLVVKISMGYKKVYSNVMELIQEGNIGLMEAVKKFNPIKGARLSTYATWWIRAFILKYIIDNMRIVKVGTTNVRRKLLFKLRKEIEKLENEGLKPQPKMLAEHFGVKEDDIIDVSHALSSSDLSFDSPVSDSSGVTFIDFLHNNDEDSDECIAKKQLSSAFKEHIDKFESDIGEYQKTILRDRILSEDPVTLKDIGNKFGVTREAVRQAEERLKIKLEKYLRKELEHHI